MSRARFDEALHGYEFPYRATETADPYTLSAVCKCGAIGVVFKKDVQQALRPFMPFEKWMNDHIDAERKKFVPVAVKAADAI